jgi:ketosteroid isomerase-like protein
MPEESTRSDLIARTEELVEVRGADATMPFYAADAVYDMSRVGLGTFQGRAAIRAFFDDWLASYAGDTEDESQEVVDLGHGIVFAVVRETARPSGRPPEFRVHGLYGFVFVWTGGKVARVRSTPTSTKPAQPPSGSPRSGGRRCRSRTSS